MILKRERRQSAYAETKCEVWRVDKEEFIELMNQNEDIKSEIIQQAIKKEELAMKEEMKLLRAKLKENPSLNSIIFDEILSTPSQNKLSKEEMTEQDQNSLGEFINEEIVIQSKKRAYSSSVGKELTMTDIIKMSAHRHTLNYGNRAVD